MDQGGEVVRAHVEQRSGTLREQELGAGVEDVGTDVLHDRLRGQRLTDVTAGDGPTGGLHTRTEHGVRGDPDE